MENQTKRPISVWIAQILIMLFSIVFLLPILMIVPVLIANPTSFSIFGLLLVLTVYLTIIVLFQLAFWGMVWRRAYGRWIGVSVLFMIIVFSILGQFARPSGPFEYQEYENAVQATAGLFAQITIVGLLTWLALTLAFGKKVNAFFSPLEEPTTSSDAVRYSNPPDPPTWNG